MKSTLTLFTAVLLAPLAALHAADAPSPAAKPNIIFFLADDFGLADIGCYGSAYKTPNLDALAAGGTRFEYCFAAPLCAPTRAMGMFGRYGFRTGVTDNGLGAAATPQSEVCIAKVLKQAGYATAVAGKWSDLEYLVTPEDGAKWGFDEFMIWGERWEEGGGRSRYWGPDYNHNGRIIAGNKKTFGPDLLHEFAVSFIRQHREQPFFLYYPTPLIHYKLQPTPDSVGKKSDLHTDNIAYLDKLVGKLVAELESLKLRERTLIVFAGDNGSTKGAHTVHGRPIFGKKGELNDGGCRVPLILNWPGTTPAGKVSKDLVSITDFFPTFTELAGGTLPAGVTIDGHSIAPQALGQSGKPRQWVYVQLRSDRYVRDARWKLTSAGTFFDMRDAPWSEIPVPADTTNAEAKAARAKLQAALDGVVAQDRQAAKRAWESAPAEKKALWQQQREALKHIDLADDTQRQIVIARGSPKPGEYHAHPTTAMLADNKTMFCVWNIGHGGHAGPMARSDDAGLTWTRMDDVLPPNYTNFKNCPSIYRITDPQGKERLWVFAARTLTDKENPKLIEGRHQGFMPRIVSEDDGKTWRELPPIGGRIAKDDPFRCIMTFSSIVRLKDGSSLGLFHRGSGIGEEGTLQVLQSITRDGGFTWSPPVVVCDGTKLDGKHPCEPYVFRSPDGNELCCLMRENRRSGTSLVMISRDEGKTWSKATDAPWGLTGDRHHGITLPDGRLVIVFRNASPNAKDKGFIAWIGTYDDIKSGKPGQYRVSLLKTFKDGFYPGIHLLPDGTIVATTYANYRKEDIGCSIVSIRFKMSEVDAMANKTTSRAKP